MEYQDVEKSQQIYEKGYVGVDKIGRPVFLDRCGKIDLSKF